ncbi:hypothetical protein SFC88_22715 [Nocardioides sp. HM23]|uniref:hypothetical protein n=1 Tax=Nocardioides bizhenqiangii TaxID=3095076 RepID=UPI002ACA562E|nr:hypothetical protein [Nocardioides sp. HM23]MDZ5623657.1 hypothetical protein [Nocardioides sp. HM23]
MRSTTATRSLILGGVLAGALALGAVQASGDDGPGAEQKASSSSSSAQAAVDKDQSKASTVSERGIVLEGTGTWRGQPVAVFVYENRKHGNSLQMVIGDPDGKHAIGAGEGRDPYVIDGVLNVGLEVDGDLAVVKGSVTESGDPRPATESAPDGELNTTTGTHTPLLVQATFEYRGETVDLSFSKSFEYDLESTRGVS